MNHDIPHRNQTGVFFTLFKMAAFDLAEKNVYFELALLMYPLISSAIKSLLISSAIKSVSIFFRISKLKIIDNF